MTANTDVPVSRSPGARPFPNARLAVLYATREGPSRRVAMRVANTLRARGATVDLEDVPHAPSHVSLRHYAAVVIVASVQIENHERAMIDFVAAHRRELDHVHTALLTVSSIEAGVETLDASTAVRVPVDADANAMIESFCMETGWRPERVLPVAGAPRYSQYGFAARFVTRPLANKTVGSTATKLDVGYTDWAALDHFVDDVSMTWVPASITARSAALAIPADEC